MTPIDISTLTQQITQLMNTIISLILLIVVIRVLISALKPKPEEEREKPIAPARRTVKVVGGTLEIEE
ncbi:MAG: hypothetical protein QXK24_08845 [Ignisphaera sp.]